MEEINDVVINNALEIIKIAYNCKIEERSTTSSSAQKTASGIHSTVASSMASPRQRVFISTTAGNM